MTISKVYTSNKRKQPQRGFLYAKSPFEGESKCLLLRRRLITHGLFTVQGIIKSSNSNNHTILGQVVSGK